MNLPRPLRAIRRLLARYRLHRAGYCTRHLIRKSTPAQVLRRGLSSVYAGKLIPSSLIEGPCELLDHLDSKPYCELCREEDEKREKARLNRALAELGGKLG